MFRINIKFEKRVGDISQRISASINLSEFEAIEISVDPNFESVVIRPIVDVVHVDDGVTGPPVDIGLSFAEEGR